MSYLLDKKNRRKRFSVIALCVIILIFLFYFRVGIWIGLSKASQVIFHPVLVLGDKIDGKFKSLGAYFAYKSSLYEQNQNLEQEVATDDARMANYDSVVSDNASLKQILGRADPKAMMVLAAILAKPNQSPYDILLIDAGTAQGIQTGDRVFALGDIPIGTISDIYSDSAKVILFSNPGQMTDAMVEGNLTPAPATASTPITTGAADTTTVSPPASTTPTPSGDGHSIMQLIGRGGGNFEMDLPKDFTLQKGDQVVLPGIHPYLIAIAETILSDPRDPFNKALLVSPVNVQDLKFVEVEQ